MPNEPDDVNKVSSTLPDETGSIDTTPESYRPPTTDLSYKRPSPWRKWLLILLVAVLAGVVVWAVYYFVTLNATPKETAKDSPTRFASAKALIDQATPNLKGEAIDVYISNGLGGKTVDGLGVYGMASEKVGGRKYANLPAKSTGAGYKGNSEISSKNYDALVTFFKNNHFNQVDSGKNASGPISWTSADVSYVSYATYSSDDVLCMIWHADASQTSLASHITSIGCGDKSSYDEAAKALDPFFAAYTKGEADPSNDIVLGMPENGNGTDGYKHAILLQEDPSQLDQQFEALYFQAPGQTEWTYFTGAHGIVSCSEFNTDILKKAFHGIACYDDAAKKNSTV